MTNIKTGVEQRDPYEDGCLGGLKDNRHASKFKQRRERIVLRTGKSQWNTRKGTGRRKAKAVFRSS